MYRFNPRTFEFSFHAPNSPNPHGSDFDYWGYHYATDATGGAAFQVKTTSEGTFAMRSLLQHTVRPVPSSGILSSSHLPEANNGNFLILNVIAFLGIKQYTLSFDEVTGDAFGTETDDLLASSDPNFRPTDFEIGDDGGVYIADWSNAVIGHMQHNIRDPARDHAHGRIYRITVPGRPLSEHVPIDGEPIPALLEALEHPVNGVRRRARVELSERPTPDVIAATRDWMSTLDPRVEEDAHHLLEALWLHQQHNVVNRELLDLVLNSPVAHARIAARTVERMWDHNVAAPVREVSAGAGAADAIDPPDDAIVIRTVVEQMRYDTPTFTVRPGDPVRVWFENDDYAPHNLIIVDPGAGDVIGAAADGLGADGFARGFVPDDDRILVASDLLNYQKWQLLEFTAPMEPGDYEVLCTFPGHRATMNGIMRVEGR
jgi:azurin